MSGGGSWKVAYADFVTAMMAFFLLLWLTSALPEDQLKVLAGYFRAPGGYDTKAPTGLNAPPIVAPTKDKVDFAPGEAGENNAAIGKALKEMLDGQEIPVYEAGMSISENGVLLRVTGGVMYEPDSVVLSPSGKLILDKIISIMKDFKVNVIVRGHTSSGETGAPHFSSKWELSAARSAAAVSYLIEHGSIDSKMIMSAAFADTRPQVPDKTGEDAAQNRRVEFYFVKPGMANTLMGY